MDKVNRVYENGFHAVKDFSLNISDGEFMMLVGPLGSGKTTVLRMAAGLEDIPGPQRLTAGASRLTRGLAGAHDNQIWTASVLSGIDQMSAHRRISRDGRDHESARTVLRGPWRGNAPGLPGGRESAAHRDRHQRSR